MGENIFGAFQRGVAGEQASAPTPTPVTTPADPEAEIIDRHMRAAQAAAMAEIAAERAEQARRAEVAGGNMARATREEYQRHLDALATGITAVDLPPDVTLPEGPIDAKTLSPAQFALYMQTRLDGPRPQPVPLVDALEMSAAEWNAYAAAHGLDCTTGEGAETDRAAAERRAARVERERADREVRMLAALEVLAASQAERDSNLSYWDDPAHPERRTWFENIQALHRAGKL